MVSAVALGFQRSMPAGFSHAFGELRSQIDHIGTSSLTAQAAFDRYSNSVRLVGEATNRTHSEETKLLNLRNQSTNVAAQIAAQEALVASHYGRHSGAAQELQQEEQKLQTLRTKGNNLAVQQVTQEGRVVDAEAMHAQRLQESGTAHERYNQSLEQTTRHFHLGAIGTAALTGAVTSLTFAVVNLVSSGLGAMVRGLEDVVKAGADAVEKVVDIGQHFQELNREVALFTTESGPALASLQESMRNIYANMLDVPSKKLGETIGVLHAQFGLTGQDLETLTMHITELGERFGELPVREFAAAMHQFGIEGGPNLDKALGQLIYDTQQFGIALPQLMSDMVQMGPIWDALHVNYNSAALAIARITQLGDPARRVMLGLSQTAKEMAKGPDPDGTFKQYVSDVIETMENLHKAGQDQLADAFALSEFGVRTWALLKQTLDPIQDAIRGVGSETAKIDLTNLIDQTRILHEKVTLFRHDVEARLAPLGLSIVQHIGGGLDKVQHWFDTHQTEIAAKIKEWGDRFIDNIPKIQHFVGEAVKFIGDFITFSVDGLGFVSEAFGLLFHNETMTKFGQALSNFDMRPMTDKIGDVIENVHIDTNPLHEWLGTSINSMMKDQPTVGIKADLQAPDGKSLLESTKAVAKDAGISFGKGFEEGFQTAAAEHMPPWLKFLFEAGNVNNVPGHGAVAKVLEPPPQDRNPDPSKRSSPYGGGTPGAEPDKGARGGGGNVGEDPEKFRAGQAYEKDHGGRMPPNYQRWLENRGPMPPEMEPYYRPKMPATPGYGLHWEDGKGWVPDQAKTSGYTEPVTNAPTAVVLVGKYDPAPHSNEPAAPPGIGAPTWPGMPRGGGKSSGKDPALQAQEQQDRLDNARDSLDDANDAYKDAASTAKLAKEKDQPIIDRYTKELNAKAPGGGPAVVGQPREDMELKLEAAIKELTRSQHAAARTLHAQERAERALTEATMKSAEAVSGGRKSPGQSFLSGVTGSIGLGDIFGDNQGLLKLLGISGGDESSQGSSSSPSETYATPESGPSQTSTSEGSSSATPGSASLQPSVSVIPGSTPAISGATLAGATFPAGGGSWHDATLASASFPDSGAAAWSPRPIAHAPMGGGASFAAAGGTPHLGTGILPGPATGASPGGGPPVTGSLASYIISRGQQLGLTPTEIGMALAVEKHEGLGPTGSPSMGFGPEAKAVGMNFDSNPQGAVDQYFQQYTSRLPTGLDRNDANAIANYIWHTVHHAADPNYGPELLGAYPGPAVGPGPGLSGPDLGRFAENLPARPEEEHLQPASVFLRRELFNAFPELQTIGGWREKDEKPWHPSGRALDVMIPGQGGLNDPTTPEGKKEGDRIFAWLQANAGTFGIQMSGTLWQQADHYNHIHVQLAGPMPDPRQPPQATDITPIGKMQPPLPGPAHAMARGGLVGFQHGGVVGFDQGGEAGGDNFYKHWYPRSQTPTPTASTPLLRPDSLGGLLGGAPAPASVSAPVPASATKPWSVITKPWVSPVTPLIGFRSEADEHRATTFGKVSRAVSSFSFGLIPDVALDYDTMRHWGQHTGMEQAGAVLDTASMIPGLGTVLGAAVGTLGHGVVRGISALDRISGLSRIPGAFRTGAKAETSTETVERALAESKGALAASGPKPIPGSADDTRWFTKALRPVAQGMAWPFLASERFENRIQAREIELGLRKPWDTAVHDPLFHSPSKPEGWTPPIPEEVLDAQTAARADEQMRAVVEGDATKALYGDYPPKDLYSSPDIEPGDKPPDPRLTASGERLPSFFRHPFKYLNLVGEEARRQEVASGVREPWDTSPESGLYHGKPPMPPGWTAEMAAEARREAAIPSAMLGAQRAAEQASRDAQRAAAADKQMQAFVEGDAAKGLYGDYPPNPGFLGAGGKAQSGLVGFQYGGPVGFDQGGHVPPAPWDDLLSLTRNTSREWIPHYHNLESMLLPGKSQDPFSRLIPGASPDRISHHGGGDYEGMFLPREYWPKENRGGWGVHGGTGRPPGPPQHQGIPPEGGFGYASPPPSAGLFDPRLKLDTSHAFTGEGPKLKPWQSLWNWGASKIQGGLETLSGNNPPSGSFQAWPQIPHFDKGGAVGFQHGGEAGDDHSGFEDLMIGPINKASGALFTGEGPEYYGAAFNYNRQFAKPSTTNYQTKLSPAEEKSFRAWVKDDKVNFNPNESVSDYDMRGYWKSTGGASTSSNPWKGRFFPDTFKTPYDTDFSPQSIYSKPNNPLKWTDGATLKNTRDGTIVFFDAQHYKSQPGQESIGKALGGVVGFAGGGAVGPTDTVPALLTPGSVVLNTRAVAAIGLDAALGLNALGFAPGGEVPVSAAPNIQASPAMEKFKQDSLTGALGGISSIAAGLGADFNPKQWHGLLTQPEQRQSAVHYNNSIHIKGNTVADPAGLQRAMQEQQNAQRVGAQ